jgi:hypothetical protein
MNQLDPRYCGCAESIGCEEPACYFLLSEEANLLPLSGVAMVVCQRTCKEGREIRVSSSNSNTVSLLLTRGGIVSPTPEKHYRAV